MKIDDYIRGIEVVMAHHVSRYLGCMVAFPVKAI